MDKKKLLYIVLLLQFCIIISMKYELLSFNDVSFLFIFPTLLIIGYIIKKNKNEKVK